MLTISDVARKYNISNRQVHDLVNYGYLNVARVARNQHQGINYLFSENQLNNIDIHSYLAEIYDKKNNNHYPGGTKSSDFKKVRYAINHYDRFLQNIEDYPEKELLKVCFHLYHLNHYAKKYSDKSRELYYLKSQVLRKIYLSNSILLTTKYLTGSDRKKIWLCEDCKDSARSAGLSYITYIRQELYCPNCFISSIEKEYYSLVEFRLNTSDYGFNFHLPRSTAIKWMTDIDQLPQENRKTGKYDDQMYLYGRRITRVEEKVFPLDMIIAELTKYLADS